MDEVEQTAGHIAGWPCCATRGPRRPMWNSWTALVRLHRDVVGLTGAGAHHLYPLRASFESLMDRSMDRGWHDMRLHLRYLLSCTMAVERLGTPYRNDDDSLRYAGQRLVVFERL